MSGFQDTDLAWDGQVYTVKAVGIMTLLVQIEDLLGGDAVVALHRDPARARLCRALGAAIRHAGGDVTDEQILYKVLEGVARREPWAQSFAQTCVMDLLKVVAPPVHAVITADSDEKKQQAADGE